MISIALFGATGRLGQEIVKAADRREFSFSSLLASANNQYISRDLGAELGLGSLGVTVSAPQGALPQADVVIDVSSPEGTSLALDLCVKQKLPLLVATTGLSADILQKIEESAKQIPIVQAANLSVGVNVLARMVEFAAKTLGASFDIEIVEAHHRKKKDSPSGTALLLANAAAAGRALDLATAARHGRQGIVGERAASEIGLHAVRGGSVVGDHQVLFLGDGERVTLSHMAESRAVFAYGALRAARWLVGKPAGKYTMGDVLARG
jgi:4-hydroxy-tetrahydrodipicolinate reductase